MLRKRILKKLFITTLTAFILMSIYMLPNKENELLPTSLEIEYLSGLGTNNIYLITDNNHLVRSKIILDNKDIEKDALKILNTLIKDNNQVLPNGLYGVIPKETKMKEISYNNKVLTINFSKELFNIDSSLSKSMIESIVFSLTDINDIEKVKILVEGEILDKYPNTNYPLASELDKNIGINKRISINNRNDIDKVVIYYVESIDNNEYYVPVTKYINNNESKIKVIIDELTSSYIYEPNLISFLNSNTKLKQYEEKDESLVLDFTQGIFDTNNKILEEVLYTISYSVFDNYDVNKVVFKVNDKKMKEIHFEDLP